MTTRLYSSLGACLTDIRDNAAVVDNDICLLSAGGSAIPTFDGNNVEKHVTIQAADSTNVALPKCGTSGSVTTLNGIYRLHGLTFLRENTAGSGDGDGRLSFGGATINNSPLTSFQSCTEMTIDGGEHWNDTLFSGATAEADDDLISKTAHGLVANQLIQIKTVTGGLAAATGTSLLPGTWFYVSSSGLTANKFKISKTPGGTAINIQSDATDISIGTELPLFYYNMNFHGRISGLTLRRWKWVQNPQNIAGSYQRNNSTGPAIYMNFKNSPDNVTVGTHNTGIVVEDFESFYGGGDGFTLTGTDDIDIRRGEVAYFFDNHPSRVDTSAEDHNDGVHCFRGDDIRFDSLYFHHITYQALWMHPEFSLFANPNPRKAYVGEVSRTNIKYHHMGKALVKAAGLGYNGGVNFPGGGDAIGDLTVRGPSTLLHNSQDYDTIQNRGFVFFYLNHEAMPTHYASVTTSDVFTFLDANNLPTTHGFSANDPVVVRFIEQGYTNLKVGSSYLVSDTTYYARDVMTTSIKLSTTPGGAAINVTEANSNIFIGYELPDADHYVINAYNNVFTIAKYLNSEGGSDRELTINWDGNVQSRLRDVPLSSSSTTLLTAASTHGLLNRDDITCLSNGTSSLTEGARYWVAKVSATTYRISTTLANLLAATYINVGTHTGILFSKNYTKGTNDLPHGTTIGFVNSAQGDFTLTQPTTAIDMGRTQAQLPAGITLPDKDFAPKNSVSPATELGNDRTNGLAPDLGVIEMQVTPPSGVPPVVNAGPDFAVLAGEPFTIVGSAIDADDDPITYSWAQLSGTVTALTDDDTATPSGTAPDAATTLVYEVTATADSEDDTDTVSITVLVPENPGGGGGGSAVSSGAIIAVL